MSHVGASTASADLSAPQGEKSASSPAFTATRAQSASSSPLPAAAPKPVAPPSSRKPRSCVVCRSRRVRCDKQSPCSNCRRANIACVVPAADRPPKWARRLAASTSTAAASDAPSQDVDKVMDRLHTLESLVHELRGQLEQAQAGPGSTGTTASSGSSPAANGSGVEKQFGRLVLQDGNQSRYVSSGFWSRVNDELDGLKADTHGLANNVSESSDDEGSTPQSTSTRELDRTPADRHAFLFGHNLTPTTPDLRDLHPLPSQIPFLLDVFAENVNLIMQVVHMPSLKKMVRDLRGSNTAGLSPPNEALMFSIYYAAVTSMEEEDVTTNFLASKTDLNLRYRLGLEHALAKADFLNAPDIVLVQALALFLCLVRRHDSPRFVWMMTGLMVRMAQYLGLQRDGSHFENMSVFEKEIRRRVWWAVTMLDVRACEDQGTDLTIAYGSFDTHTPLNVNDADIYPEMTEQPAEREGATDMSYMLWSVGMTDLVRRMMAAGVGDGTSSLEEQNRLLSDMCEKYENNYFQRMTGPSKIADWVGIAIARLTRAKMTLIVYLPILFSSESELLSDEIRNKLLVSAMEIAEFNHALNAEQSSRQWRWVYQVYTHWHAIVYLLLDISRRPWSAMVERAWLALHSSWLIPAQTGMNKSLRIWLPLRRLMGQARKHRDAELERLRSDPQAAVALDMEDRKIPLPSSSELVPAGQSEGVFRDRWRQLVGIKPLSREWSTTGNELHGGSQFDRGLSAQSMGTAYNPDHPGSSSTNGAGNSNSSVSYPNGLVWNQGVHSTQGRHSATAGAATASGSHNVSSGLENDIGWSSPGYKLGDPSADLLHTDSLANSAQAPQSNAGATFMPWLWADADPSVDVYSDFNVDTGEPPATLFADADMNMNFDQSALDNADNVNVQDIDWWTWVNSAEKNWQW